MSVAVPELDGEEVELDFDVPEDTAVSIVTQGDPIRSLSCVVSALVTECCLRFDEDGVSTKAVDPANVGLVDVSAPAGAWTGYECHEEITIGMPLKRLRRALKFARKRRGDGDPVHLDILGGEGARARCRVTVIRPDEQVRRVSEFHTIDPDSVRQEPEIPDLDLDNYARVNIGPFREAIESFERDYAWISRDSQTLLVGSQRTSTPQLDEDTDLAELFEFPASAWGDADEEGSLFSLDYLTDMVAGLDDAKVDHLTMRFGEQFPVFLRGEWVDWGFNVDFVLAPRIGEEDV